jgi:hypothetical protein
MKQGRGTRVCQETAERLRKPESGTWAGKGHPVRSWGSLGDAVEGTRNSREVGSDRQVGRPEGGEELCKGFASRENELTSQDLRDGSKGTARTDEKDPGARV